MLTGSGGRGAGGGRGGAGAGGWWNRHSSDELTPLVAIPHQLEETWTTGTATTATSCTSSSTLNSGTLPRRVTSASALNGGGSAANGNGNGNGNATLSIEEADPQQVLARARRLLYVSHFFSQFSEVAWQFALVLFLAAFTNYQSLVLVSTYGLVSGLGVCWLGATTGKHVVDDRSNNRLVVARTLIWCENASVVIATALCYLLLLMHKTAEKQQQQQQQEGFSMSLLLQRLFPHVPLDFWSVTCLIGLHVFGPLAQILDRGFLVAMERDWVVVMSQVAATHAYYASTTTTAAAVVVEDQNHHNGHYHAQRSSNGNSGGGGGRVVESSPSIRQQNWLSETNVAMRQIDLTCKVVAPAVAGFVVAAFDSNNHYQQSAAAAAAGSSNHRPQHEYVSDLTGAALLVGIVNVAALFVEYVCTSQIYHMIPALAVKDGPILNGSNGVAHHPTNGSASASASSSTSTSNTTRYFCGIWTIPPSLQVYLNQPIAPAGLGLALLYLNALTFGALMTAYLIWRGMKLETVGIWRGLSSAVGLAGTLVYHYAVNNRRVAVVSVGMWSVVYQLAWISLSFAALFVPSYDVSMAMLIFGVCASRIGLWVFDIAVTQLMQEFIPDGIRGVVGGTQQSLNSFFQLLSFALGLVFPDPKSFCIYVGAGYAAVVVAAFLYAWGVYRKANDFFLPGER